jgi:RNA polymerase sigma factor (sigma-70 family)
MVIVDTGLSLARHAGSGEWARFDGGILTMTGDDDLEVRFDRLFRDHYGRLVSFFGQRRVDPETSRDLAEETMLRVLRGLDGLESPAATASWIRGIALNVWKNWVRDRRTLRRSHEERSLEEALREGLQVSNEGSIWPQSDDSPERELLAREVLRHLPAILCGLPRRKQEVFRLWLEGRTYQQIASELGVSIQAVRSNVSRARQRVLKELKRLSQSHTPR